MGILEQHYLENKDTIDARVNAKRSAKTSNVGSGHVPVGEFNRYTDPARQPKMNRHHMADIQRQVDDYNAQAKAFNDAAQAYESWATNPRDAGAIAADMENATAQIESLQKQVDILGGETAPVTQMVGMGAGVGVRQHSADIERQRNDLLAQIDMYKRQQKDLDEEKYWSDYYRYMNLPNSEEYEKYSQIGKNRKNPSVQDVIAAWQTGTYNEDMIRNIVEYSRNNYDDVVSLVSPVGDELYSQMTEEEVNNYNYLLAKDGKEAAQAYLDFLADQINRRKGHELAQPVTNIKSPFLRGVASLPGAFGNALGNAGEGIEQLVTGDVKAPTASDYAEAEIRGSLGKGGQIAYDATAAVGNMAPSIAASALVGPWAGLAMTGASSAGNAYAQAKSEGYSDEKARSYGLLVGASEALLQYALGGVGAIGGVTDDILMAKAQMLKSAVGRLALGGVIKIGTEVAEEELQLLLEPLFASMVLGEDYQAPTFGEAWDTAVVTALSTAILEGHSVAGVELNYKAYGDMVTKGRSKQDIVKSAVRYSEPYTNAGKLANDLANRMAMGQDVSNTDIGRLYSFMLTEKNADQFVDSLDILGAYDALAKEMERQTENADKFLAWDGKFEEQPVQDQQAQQEQEQFFVPDNEGETFEQETPASVNQTPVQQTQNVRTPVKVKVAKKGAAQNDNVAKQAFLLDNESETFAPDVEQGEQIPPSVGATQNRFANKVVQSEGNTLPFRDTADNVPEEHRAGTTHTRVTEAETTYNARLRLSQDYNAEKAYLEETPSWKAEEVDMAFMIREDLLAEAKRTDDWAAFDKWQRLMKDRNSQAGADLQAWAKHSRHDGEWLISKASETMENVGKKVDKSEVMADIVALSDRFDKAIKKQNVSDSVDELVDVIKLSAQTRSTGFYRNKVMNLIPNKYKPLEWAINRVAEKAKNADVSVIDKNMLPANERFGVGDNVRATDRNNFGNIVANNGDGTYEVHFLNRKTGANATVTMDADQLRSVSAKAATAQVGSNGTTLSTKAFEQQAANEAYQFLKDFAENSVLNIAKDTVPATLGEEVMTARRWSLLSKLASWARNFKGNSLSDIMGILATNQAVPIDILLSKKTKTRSVPANRIFSKQGISGSLDGAAMGVLAVALDVDAMSKGKYGTGLRTNKMSGGIVQKFLSVMEGIQGFGLIVPDYIAKSGIEAEYNRGIGALYDEGLVADDSLADAGKEEAAYRTFTKESTIGKAVSQAKRMANEIAEKWGITSAVKAVIPKKWHKGVERLGLDKVSVGELSVPFAEVPANVVEMGVDYMTGLRGIPKVFALVENAKNGEMTAAEQAKVAKSIGKGITAAEIIGASVLLTIAGIIRYVDNPADEEENADERAFRKGRNENGLQWNWTAVKRILSGEDSTKWQDGDELSSVAWAEQLNNLLSFGALIAEDYQNDELSGKSFLKSAWDSTVSSAGDLPMMDVVSDAAETFQYTQGTMGDKAAAALENFAVNTAGGFIPNALKGIAQGLDPYQRDLYTADTALGQLGDQFKAVFNRDSLPIKYDSFGNPMMNEEGWSGFANANFRPGYKTTYRTNDMMDELERLAEATGTASVYPSRKAPNEITTEDGVVKLTNDQKEQYQKVYGTTENAIRTALTENDAYDRLPQNGKLKANQIAEGYAKQVAGNALDIGYEADGWINDLQGASPEEVIAEVFSKTIESLAETKGKELGGKKYDGLAWLYDEGIIDEEQVTSQMSDTMREVYDAVNKNSKKFEIGEMVDAYAAAMKAGDDKEAQFDAALAFIDDQVEGGAMDDVKATELAGAMGQILKIYIPKEQEPAAAWLKKYGAAGQQMIYNNMSDTQKKQYDWVKKAHGDLGITAYMFDTAVTYKDKLKTKKDAKGNVIKNVPTQFKEYLNTVYGSNTAVKRVIWDAIYESRSPWG